MLAAAAELRTDPALRRLTPRWIRSIARPWWEAGWTNNDLLYALEHRPRHDGPATTAPPLLPTAAQPVNCAGPTAGCAIA